MNENSSLNNVLLFDDQSDDSACSIVQNGKDFTSTENQDFWPVLPSDKITVDKPEKVLTTLDTFVTYRVRSQKSSANPDEENMVVRRYSDFVWLRQRLESKYPFCLIPPLPEKHSVYSLDRFDPDFIRYRTMGLNLFARWITRNDLLAHDVDWVEFLSLSDADQFSELKKSKITQTNQHVVGKDQQVKKIEPVSENGCTNHVVNNGCGGGNNGTQSFSIPSFLINKCVPGRKQNHKNDECDQFADYCSNLSQTLSSLYKFGQKLAKSEQDYFKELESFSTVFDYWAHSETDQVLRPRLLSSAFALQQNKECLGEIVKHFDCEFLVPANHFALYCDVGRQLARKYNQVAIEKKSIESFLHKRQQQKINKVDSQLQEAKKKLNDLQSTSEQLDNTLKCEVTKWNCVKNDEMILLIRRMVSSRAEMHKKCFNAWQDVFLKPSDVDQSFLQ